MRQTLIPALILFCAIMGCNWSGRSNSNRSAPTPVAPASPQAPSLNDEAVSTVKEFWEQHTTKCGDSYYGFKDHYPFQALQQYRGVTFVAKRTGPTTEADRLNGILWNGVVESGRVHTARKKKAQQNGVPGNRTKISWRWCPQRKGNPAGRRANRCTSLT
jgi:hypothetical protein